MTAASRKILITGFMGAGKTTVAGALASLLNLEMLDLDGYIVERAGRSIADIITNEGEAKFRETETSALREALQDEKARVIALGGGTWTIGRNRDIISQHKCLVVWLDAPFDLCWRRISNENVVRPLALDRERARALYEARLRHYGLADLRVEAGAERSPRDVATEIEAALRRHARVKN